TVQSYGGDSTPPTGVCPISNFNPNWFNGGNRSGWLFYVNPSGRWQFRLGLTSGYAGLCTATSGDAVARVWQHIVATFDGTAVKLYANGFVIGTVDTSTAPGLANWLPNPISFIRIGGTSLTGTGATAPNGSNTAVNGNRGWDGWVDELAIYPTALSASQVAA